MPDRLFESLDGVEPGTEHKTEDITDMPLRSGIPAMDYPESETVYDTAHVGIHTEEGIPDLRDDSDDREPEPTEDRSRNRVTARQRISQLTQRYRQAEGQNAELLDTINQLQREINQQNEKIDKLSRRPAAPVTDDTYGSGQTESPPAYARDELRQVIAEAIEPFRREQEEHKRRSQLEREQTVAFNEALKVLPELSKNGSETQELYRELWNSSPLRGSPDGPLHVAYQLKGLLAEDSAERPVREARKRASSVVRPGPTPDVTTPQAPSHRYQKLYEEAMKRQRSGGGTAEDYIAARKIGRKLGRSFQRPMR